MFVEVEQSFQSTCSGTQELGVPKRLSLIFRQAEDFTTIIRISVGIMPIGLDALSLTAASLIQSFSYLFSPKVFDLHSSWMKQPSVQHFTSICPCAPRQRICWPRIQPCCSAILWEEQFITAMSCALASPAP